MAAAGDHPKMLTEVQQVGLGRDGTAYIVWGSGIAGLAGYAYQLLGGRVLGAERFAPVSVLLTVHFLTFIVVLLPIEQLLIRRITIDPTAELPRRAYWLAAVTVAGAMLFATIGVDDYLNGDRRFIVFTALTVATHFVFASARGRLAGGRRFRAYGLASGLASLTRLVIAVGITMVRPSASGFAIALILGPLVVVLWRPHRPAGPGTTSGSPPEERGLLAGLLLSSAASQALLLSGPIVVGLLGGSAVEISISFAAFTLARAPLVFGYNLLARVLPPFTRMAVRRQGRELRAWAQGMAWTAVALAVGAAALGWLLGPWAVGVAFGADFVPNRLSAALVATGVVFSGAGLFVGQILVAKGQPGRLAAAWMGGVVSAAVAIIATRAMDPVTRVATGFAIGEVVSSIILVAAALVPSPGEEGLLGYELAKRTLDISVSLLALLLSIPIVLLAAVAIRLDSPGPALIRQTRIGRNGVPFGLVKMRTMTAHADEGVHSRHIARLEATRDDPSAPLLRIESDTRVTRFGRLLRRWSIDELPNLWNVLAGSVSLVGPRPLVPVEAEMIGLGHPRFSVKPGITGLAQVGGRDNITLVERIRLDHEYVERRSMRLDLAILLHTVRAVIVEPVTTPADG